MRTDVKKFSIQAVSIAFVAALTWFAIFAWNSISQFIKKGLLDSQKIRVSEKTSCSVSQNQDEPHFSGCNSIL
jgi:hypothetical protein